MEIDRTNGL